MNYQSLVPSSRKEATARLTGVSRNALVRLNSKEFLKAWFAVAYAFPGLHPDDFDSKDSSWPDNLKLIANEAWTRTERGELEEKHLYPADSQWAAIYDQLESPTQSETNRRREIDTRYRF